MKTKVIFRKFKKGGEIFALFPYEVWNDYGHCASYQHVGQHSSADYNYCIKMSVPAKPKEYGELLRELMGRGYKLDVKKRK